MKLTKSAIDGLPDSPKATTIYWDDQLKGFGLRVYPSGKKSFVVGTRIKGKWTIHVLGPYGVLTPIQGRELALQKLSEIRLGQNPFEKSKGVTLGQFAREYIERHACRKKSERIDRQMIDTHLVDKFAQRPLDGITRAEIAKLHHEVGKKTPYKANRLLSLISKMYELAITWGHLPEAHPNPAKRIERFKEEKRERYVTKDEMPRLLAAIDTEESPYIRSAIWLYLLTGVRKSELLRVKWGDIDLDRCELSIPDTKADRPHLLPLSSLALEVLRKTPKEVGNEYVFPSGRTGGHLVNIEKPWGRIKIAAGLKDVRLHDLRRTVGSYMAQAGASINLIGKILNHSNLSTTQVYARFNQDPMRDALEAHAEVIKGIVKAGKRKPRK
jgi:integrase